jgi:HK97 family phage major capsid protein
MKRLMFAGAIALVACAIVAVLATHGVLADGNHLIMAAGAAAAVSPDDLKALTTQLTTIEGQMAKAADEVKKNGETLQAEMKNLGKATAETTTKVDDALLKHGELAKAHGETASRLTEIEQKLAARRSEQEPVAPKSMGERFVESAEFKGFKGKGAIRVQMNRADITNVTGTVGNNTSQGNSLVTAARVPGIVTPPERQLTIRSLIAPGQTDQGMQEFVQETGFTNNAGVVTEGATKPKSDLTFELKNAPVRTIAHIFKASRTILDDAPALRSSNHARAR